MDVSKEVVDYGVIGALLFMSVVSVGIALERWLFMARLDLGKYKSRRELEVELTRGLHIIATVGSNAPYVGLLGTVLGIMITFHTIGGEGLANTKEIMVGLALALKATAVGLMVAIPSIFFYNTLLRKVKVLIALWEEKHGG
ncbi:MAG TPA: TonB-system energizer ExbB [Aquifex aeolicus]|nr:TonB-system energizer ExbB [Aquifex aeolicus]